MGFFGLFGNKKSALEKHAERAANRRAQAPDRWESIQALGKLATAGEGDERTRAVAALLQRFPFYVDPSITDGEEKDETFRWICQAGEDVAVPAIREALARHESLSWPLRCLETLLSEEQVIGEILTLLGNMSTEYVRDPQRKLQLLGTLEQKRDLRIAEVVARFFEDVNESARYHAFGAALVQDNAESVMDRVVEALGQDDSVRVKVHALEAIAERGLTLPTGKDKLQLPEGWSTDPKGVPRKAKPKS